MPRFWNWIDGQSIHGDGVYSGWTDGHPLPDGDCGYIDTEFPPKNEKEKVSFQKKDNFTECLFTGKMEDITLRRTA